MLHFVLVSVLFFALSTASAAPANPFPTEVFQSDGSKITVTSHGDEFFDWTEDSDGNVIAYNDVTTNWCYAYISGDQILPGTQIAGRETRSPIPKITRGDLKPLLQNITRFDYSELAKEGAHLSVSPLGISAANTVTPSTGGKLLLVLIEFNNVKLIKDEAYWHEKYFSDADGTKSVVNYYKDVSGGLDIFKPVFTEGISNRTGKVSHTDVNAQSNNATISYENIEYTLDTGTAGNGIVKVTLNTEHPVKTWDNAKIHEIRAVTALALKAIGDDFDFSQSNLHLAAIIAGFDASVGASAGSWQTWAHAWGFNNTLSLSGKMLGRYMVHGEKYNASSPMGIGVPCHELGHTLGLPDLYDTTGMSSGIGPYSLMGSGNWGRTSSDQISGDTPVHFDAWSKITLGYVNPETVNADGYWKNEIHSISLLSTGAYNVLKITDTAVDIKQYFLAENRGLYGYDEGLWAYGIRPSNNNHGGIIVYHIDENITSGTGSNIKLSNNNKYHKAVDVEEADNSTNLDDSNKSVAWDLKNARHFFVADGNHEFNASTTPSANFYTRDDSSTHSGECHPQSVYTAIQLTVNSPQGASMEVVADANSTVTTTGILIAFSNPVEGLTDDNITIVGATKGGLKKIDDDGTTWLIGISDIQVESGETVNIKIASFEHFIVETVEADIIVYKS